MKLPIKDVFLLGLARFQEDLLQICVENAVQTINNEKRRTVPTGGISVTLPSDLSTVDCLHVYIDSLCKQSPVLYNFICVCVCVCTTVLMYLLFVLCV